MTARCSDLDPFFDQELPRDAAREFREHLGGELTITLLEGIGRPVDVHRMDTVLVERALDWIEARHRTSSPPPPLRSHAP